MRAVLFGLLVVGVVVWVRRPRHRNLAQWYREAGLL